eukprot:CAMPEP_0194514680 /NCGR_PEP_ID=MMETSP0253-20130528/47190_1 /TAXON_ID=2966 /ORGANISM="Noctiluca scintillans" /LENGTH=187 /DNA_ID=CAMNT_0039358367 /DNA_START=65 /DNA_END=628 /DNA_ORIENTATION=+
MVYIYTPVEGTRLNPAQVRTAIDAATLLVENAREINQMERFDEMQRRSLSHSEDAGAMHRGKEMEKMILLQRLEEKLKEEEVRPPEAAQAEQGNIQLKQVETSAATTTAAEPVSSTKEKSDNGTEETGFREVLENATFKVLEIGGIPFPWCAIVWGIIITIPCCLCCIGLNNLMRYHPMRWNWRRMA